MKKQLQKRLEEFKIRKEVLERDLKEFCKDESSTLDDRWEFFKESDIGDHDGCYVNFEEYGIDIYNDRGYKTDKYETVNLVDVINEMEEVLNFDEDKVPSYRKKQRDLYTWEMINGMKEKILQEFVKSCEFDW